MNQQEAIFSFRTSLNHDSMEAKLSWFAQLKEVLSEHFSITFSALTKIKQLIFGKKINSCVSTVM